MGRYRTNQARKFFDYIKSCNVSICKLCGKPMKNDHGANLQRHIMRFHTAEFEQTKHNTTIEPNMKLESTFPFDETHLEEPFSMELCETQVMEACVELVAINGCSVELVEYSGFRKLMNPILNALGNDTLTINIDNLKHHLANRAAAIISNVEVELQNQKICLKLDMIAKLEHTLLLINAQYVKQGKLNVYTLSVDDFSKKNFTDVILRTLQKYNVSRNQICNITIDSNTCEEFETLRFNDLDELCTRESSLFNIKREAACCTSNNFKMVLSKFLNSVNVGYYIDSYSGAKKSTAPTIDTRLTKKLLDAPTLWTKSSDMLKTLFEASDESVRVNYSNFNFELSQEDGKSLESIYECVKPIKDIWTLLQRQNLALSDFYSMCLECKIKLNKLSNSNYLVKFIVGELEQIEWNILKNEQMLAAIFLDPRYQLLLTANQKFNAKIHLEYLWQKVCDVSESEIEIKNDELMDNDDELENMLKRKEMELDVKKPMTPIEINSALLHFDGVHRLSRKESILKYWEDNKVNNPVLYELSRAIFAIPASHATLDRAISVLDHVCRNNKNILTDGTLEDILLIRLNQ